MTPEHLPQVKHIIDSNQMFPSDMLKDMTAPFLNQESLEFWCVVSDFKSKKKSNPDILAVAYCAPEMMTDNTWNLLLIAVSKTHQGAGIGGQLITHMETEVKQRSGRILLVETSGTSDFELTRKFYPKCGYLKVARIPEFYTKGDDKIVFWKKLTD